MGHNGTVFSLAPLLNHRLRVQRAVRLLVTDLISRWSSPLAFRQTASLLSIHLGASWHWILYPFYSQWTFPIDLLICACLWRELRTDSVCTHRLPHGFFSPPFLSSFYQGALAVRDAAGIRARRSPIYQLWMCPAPVGWSTSLVFSFLFCPFFILSQTLWNTCPSFLLCPVSTFFSLPLR